MASSSTRAELTNEVIQGLRGFVIRTLLAGYQAADAVDIQTTDLACLCLLSLHGPSPAGRLAELTGLTTGAITGVIDRLEAAQLAHRAPDPSDRRRVIVSADRATMERDLLPHFTIRQAAGDPAFYGSFSNDELALIASFLTRLT